MNSMNRRLPSAGNLKSANRNILLRTRRIRLRQNPFLSFPGGILSHVSKHSIPWVGRCLTRVPHRHNSAQRCGQDLGGGALGQRSALSTSADSIFLTLSNASSPLCGQSTWQHRPQKRLEQGTPLPHRSHASRFDEARSPSVTASLMMMKRPTFWALTAL